MPWDAVLSEAAEAFLNRLPEWESDHCRATILQRLCRMPRLQDDPPQNYAQAVIDGWYFIYVVENPGVLTISTIYYAPGRP